MKRLLPLLLTAALCLPAAAQIPGLTHASRLPAFSVPAHEWALLVGVSKYHFLPESQWLDGCDLDAQSLAQFLSSPRGGAFPADHVKLLVNETATTNAIRLGLDFLIKKAVAGDVVYIFFACHGKVEVYGSGEVAYLLPYDCDPQHLNATAVPMDEVRRYVDTNLRQAQVVLITDACHAGGLSATSNDAPHAFSSVAEQLQSIGERNGALNIMACRRDESATEDPRLGGHGVLTYCLLKALNGDGASPADGIVRAQDVLEYLMRQVPRLTGQEQHPRHSSNYHDEFPMARLNLVGADLHLPPLPGDTVASVNPTSFDASARSTSASLDAAPARAASLRVLGAPEASELYLVQGRQQRTVGRVLSGTDMLMVDGIPPGRYTLVENFGGKDQRWTVELAPGLHSFDTRTGQLE